MHITSVDDAFVFAHQKTYSLNTWRAAPKQRVQATYFPKKEDPEGRDKIYFKSTEAQLPLPFYFVADFESVLLPHDTVRKNPKC